MVDPISAVCLAALAQVAGSFTVGTVAGGIVGNRADAIFSKVIGRTVDHFVKNIQLPANHDLLQGVLSSHEKALAYAAETMSRQAHGPFDRIIADKITLIARKAATVDSGYAHALKAMVTPLLAGEIEDIADARRAALIDSAVGALIAWLEAESGETLPVHFRDALTEAAPNGRASWLAVFQLYISEEIKTNMRFGQMFLAENISEIVGRTVTIEAIAQDLGQGVDVLRRDLGLMAADVKEVLAEQKAQADQLTELLALARQGGIFRQANAQGISEAAVRAIVERLGGEGVTQDDLLTWLETWIETAQVALGRTSNEGEAFEAARAEAERRFRAGQSATASDPFMELLEREQAETIRRQILIIEEAAQFDALALNVAGVAAKVRLLATANGAHNFEERARYFFELAAEHYRYGLERGDNFTLLVAGATYRMALEEWTRERSPLEWAITQVNLANALLSLGERESGTARLEEAVAAYRLALEELTRDRVPLDWARTQNGMAHALFRLGQRESGTERLKEAAIGYRLALEELTRDRVPLDWAYTQISLAAVIGSLGIRESGKARLEEAAVAYRLALEELTRDRAPLEWARAHMYLATVLVGLGEREDGMARLEEAVVACRLGLEELTREQVPLDWAMAHLKLANALSMLGQRDSGTLRLEEAVAAYRVALEELTRERVPLDWAEAQVNLANALLSLGERESGTARIEEAVAAFRLALEELTRSRVPLDWAMTQMNLANALSALGERESGTGRLEEAVMAYRLALEELTHERVPLDWARAQMNLAIAISTLGQRNADLLLLDAAVAILQEASTVAVDGGHDPMANSADTILAEVAAVRSRLEQS